MALNSVDYSKLLNEILSGAFDDNSSADFLENTSYLGFQSGGHNNGAKIDKITIKKLFDEIDSEIVIDTSKCVAILTAPNGCGKTTTFKFLMFLLSPSMETLKEIYSIPFDSFSCSLSNGKTISLSKTIIDKPNTKEARNFMLHKYFIDSSFRDFDGLFDLNYAIFDKNKKVDSIGFLESNMDLLKRDSNSIEDDYLKYSYITGMRLLRTDKNPFILKINEIIAKYNCHINIDFIEANRLQKRYTSKSSSRDRKSDKDHYRSRDLELDAEKIDFLTLADEEITEKIKMWVQDYNRKLTDAKNNLPSMYINAPEINNDDFASFKKRWDNYHKELKKFYDIGILDSKETVINLSELETAFEKKASFLKTYLDAFEGTLEPLQKNYEKLKLFVDIFNKRNEITHKTIKFTQNGIRVFSGKKQIDLECLSSGEKNDFVMFYRLLFNTSRNGIVLIDEPEISLHIEWQEEYIDRLIDICQMNGLQAIVATHSPNIVNGHLDLFVDKR